MIDSRTCSSAQRPAFWSQFTGKERDNETGLDYFGARYYSGAQGRWTSTDPILISNQRLVYPQRWNLYSYSSNNPLAFIDPDGKEVQVLDDEALKRILSTLPKELQSFVQLDKSGFINKDIINKAKTKNENFNDLKELVNMGNAVLEVKTASSFKADDGKTYQFEYQSVKQILADLKRQGVNDVKAQDLEPLSLLGNTYGKGENGCSRNACAVLSDGKGKAFGAPTSDYAITTAEEIYVHGLLNLRNMPWTHESNYKSGPVNDRTREVVRRTMELYDNK
jgi:RHS repeat-associated protein